ncbi:sulfite exporter TauE/SafE family protein [Paenibacillus xylanexedens]|uniref:sulfite exporter TauE/SafE family protein n=1 Tax=Paenibacillus xylanexedens TaxID=528191 RepID=UPI003D07395E
MDLLLFVIMFILGLVGSFFSGLLGIGGAIINYPLLLYVPSWMGLEPFSAHQVSSISMFQVFFASLAGVIAFRRKVKTGRSGGAIVHRGLVLYMGSSILAGSLIGGFISGHLDGRVINLIYGILAIIAIVLMLIPGKGKLDTSEPLVFNRWIAAGTAFAVGIVSGIVGAGGAFILIPIMLTILNIPVRTTIASSLAIVFISAIGGVIGKITGGDIPMEPIIYTVIGSLLGASLGSRVSSMINVRVLRYALIALIAITAVKVWSSIL